MSVNLEANSHVIPHNLDHCCTFYSQKTNWS